MARIAAKLADMKQGARTDKEPSLKRDKVDQVKAAKMMNVIVASLGRAKASRRGGLRLRRTKNSFSSVARPVGCRGRGPFDARSCLRLDPLMTGHFFWETFSREHFSVSAPSVKSKFL